MAAKNISLKSNKGMAVIEMIPIMVIIVILLNFTLGFFGAIHTGILQSIAARNYAFESFSHQPNLFYLRKPSNDPKIKLETEDKSRGARIHSITGKVQEGNPEWIATSRNISFFKDLESINIGKNPVSDPAETSGDTHIKNGSSKGILSTKNDYAGNESVANGDVTSITAIWVRPVYGICFNATCSKW